MLPQLMFLQPPTPTHPCTAGSGLPEAGNALQGDGLPGEGDPRGLPEKQQGLGQDAGHLAATAVTLCTCTPACAYTCLCKWLGRNHIAYVCASIKNSCVCSSSAGLMYAAVSNSRVPLLLYYLMYSLKVLQVI